MLLVVDPVSTGNLSHDGWDTHAKNILYPSFFIKYTILICATVMNTICYLSLLVGGVFRYILDIKYLDKILIYKQVQNVSSIFLVNFSRIVSAATYCCVL